MQQTESPGDEVFGPLSLWVDDLMGRRNPYFVESLDQGGGLVSSYPTVRYLRQEDVVRVLRKAASDMETMLEKQGNNPDRTMLPFRAVQRLVLELAEGLGEI
jgi:hypothetical protein